MEYRPLGRTGVKVSPLCLGAMMFGAWGNPDHDESVRIIHRALDAGINFIDTADVYSRGESEEIVAKALKGRRDQVVLATKVHGAMGDGPNERGNSRRWIIQECEASLRRLGTDWIDLYQIHRFDDDTDHDETLGALTDLVRAGKVRYIGSSTYPGERDRDGAMGRRAARPASGSSASSRRTRCSFAAIESEVLPLCERHGMGVIPWSPLAGGWLSGALAQGPGAAGEHARRADPAALRPVAAREPAEAGRRRGARRARRGRRHLVDPPGARVRAPASGRDGADHRPAHDGAAREPARRRRCAARLRAPRPHRRDRPAGDDVHAGRRRLDATGGRRRITPSPVEMTT